MNIIVQHANFNQLNEVAQYKLVFFSATQYCKVVLGPFHTGTQCTFNAH